MSERYAKLSHLPENLYMEGSPVIIAAGALLKDNQAYCRELHNSSLGKQFHPGLAEQ